MMKGAASSIFSSTSSLIHIPKASSRLSQIPYFLPISTVRLLIREPHRLRAILDPGGETLLLWNRIFLFSCLMALFVDPLYFYQLHVGGPLCMKIENNISILVTVFRTIADLFYVGHIVVKFRTAFVAPDSRVFGRGELVLDPKRIARRYIRNDFFIDLAAALPIPQLLIWFVIPSVSSKTDNHNNNTLSLIVLIQYIPRLFLIFPLNNKIVKATGVVTRTAWAGAAYNLLLYMLASHVLGALWYLLSMERQYGCWMSECAKENGTNNLPLCDSTFLDCKSLELPERRKWLASTSVLEKCDATSNTTSFSFGMFADVLTDEVVGATFLAKYLYCLWWGLRNLSSYGQDLSTSTYVGETSFAILISIIGLVLFSQLIGNMQTYLQSITVRVEEWRVKRRDIEEWMRHRQLPEELKERVRRFVQYKWLATRGVDEETILQDLPLDIRREIQRHLCLKLVMQVPFFNKMDSQLLDAICERLISSLNTKDTYIIREGDPVDEMLFIIRGRLESSTTNGGRTGFFNSISLGPGDFCGEELLTWALMPNPGNFPLSTRTVRSVEEVEGFVLRAEDLKFVANQFKRLHSKKLQHAFRFYSHQWRTWGACFIQVAWRRYKKRKLAKELAKLESLYYSDDQDDLVPGDEESDQAHLLAGYTEDAGESSSAENANNFQHLGATILASKFAKNTKRGAYQKIKRQNPVAADSIKMPKLLKPEEPDFSISDSLI